MRTSITADVAQVADEEAEQVAGRAVGPVEVLDDEDDRRRRGEPLEDAEQQLEQPALGRADARARRSASSGDGTEVGDEPRELGAARGRRRPRARSGRRRRTRPRRASTTGAYGRAPSPRTMQPPDAGRRRPRGPARSANSPMSRVLPTPASPATQRRAAAPVAARAAARLAAARIRLERPMRTGLETRAAMPSIIRPAIVPARGRSRDGAGVPASPRCGDPPSAARTRESGSAVPPGSAGRRLGWPRTSRPCSASREPLVASVPSQRCSIPVVAHHLEPALPRPWPSLG